MTFNMQKKRGGKGRVGGLCYCVAISDRHSLKIRYTPTPNPNSQLRTPTCPSDTPVWLDLLVRMPNPLIEL